MDTPVGILDSGSGGLSIWKEIISILPNESTLYISDHKHMPYSEKSTSYIQNRVITLINFLLKKHVKVIVIACNTATVAGIDVYRKKFPQIPIIGVVPVIKTAALESRTRHIAVLSTQYTATSAYQDELIHKFAPHCIVEKIGSTSLVSLIEKGDLAGTEITKELVNLLDKIKADDTDILVLGCTHYPFVRNQIHAIVGKEVRILDSGGAVARQTKRIIEKEALRSISNKPSFDFYTTGNSKSVSVVASKLLVETIKFHHVRL